MKLFCEECRDDVDAIIKTEMLTDEIKGKEYTYEATTAYCPHCGTQLWAPEFHDANLESFTEVFRKENGLISLKKIRELPKKYNIGKRPLSIILGWGELTFTRFFDGDAPSKEYSQTLEKVYDSPDFYATLLEANKGLLKSDKAYKKSRKAVSALLAQENTLSKNISLAAEYILHRCPDITPLALQKLLYYIQGFYYAFYDQFPFVEECYASPCGPEFKDVFKQGLSANENFFDTSQFTEQELALLNAVIDGLGCFSSDLLKKMTTNELPWLLNEKNAVIDKERLGKFFKELKEWRHLLIPGDIKKYGKEMYEALV